MTECNWFWFLRMETKRRWIVFEKWNPFHCLVYMYEGSTSSFKSSTVFCLFLFFRCTTNTSFHSLWSSTHPQYHRSHINRHFIEPFLFCNFYRNVSSLDHQKNSRGDKIVLNRLNLIVVERIKILRLYAKGYIVGLRFIQIGASNS